MKVDRMKMLVLMAEQSMNYSDLAERAGIARQTVSEVLGDRPCRSTTLGKIARALGVQASELVKEV